MNTTRDVVAPAMRAAADEIVGPDAERLYTSDTRDLMGLFVMLRKLLQEVCFDDKHVGEKLKMIFGGVC